MLIASLIVYPRGSRTILYCTVEERYERYDLEMSGNWINERLEMKRGVDVIERETGDEESVRINGKKDAQIYGLLKLDSRIFVGTRGGTSREI